MKFVKAITVGILAALALAGCGVGVDDPEGQAAAYGQNGAVGVAVTQSRLSSTTGTQSNPPGPQTPEPPGNTGQVAQSSTGAGGTGGLPQDPVPMHGTERTGSGLPLDTNQPPDSDPSLNR